MKGLDTFCIVAITFVFIGLSSLRGFVEVKVLLLVDLGVLERQTVRVVAELNHWDEKLTTSGVSN